VLPNSNKSAFELDHCFISGELQEESHVPVARIFCVTGPNREMHPIDRLQPALTDELDVMNRIERMFYHLVFITILALIFEHLC
jgi:hypothetical protein